MSDGWEGGCLCGAVRFVARGAPTHETLCHCASCRRAAGAPVVAWVTFARDGFALTKGTLARFRSSPRVVRTFCAACGTSLTYEHDDLPKELDVTTASLDRADLAAPADHTWFSERLPWMVPGDALPKLPRSRAEAKTSSS